MIIYEFLI